MSALILLNITIITAGFVFLFSMKRKMEWKVAFIKENSEHPDAKAHSQSVIQWIAAAALWGIISMGLVVWSFSL
ncbi:hypothetical protein [Jeotgalibacillus sp. R-1-5s-1]|uniref:hypothetical protein n=1 Tax=Jeotgalibacillus sp. R-1-5s-1 TaxID=2555897 RepID=UPI00106AE760|nr:hypothetical protein [Jeotgalibacillus sp. R-1-5s-1]TFD94403.1 hypothetical protein E2491_13270 [Jeotgalibacillus sp. R-1-5s-1]